MSTQYRRRCDECEAAPANGTCVLCKTFMCRCCFDEVHRTAKTLKRHEWLPWDCTKKDKNPLGDLLKAQRCQRHNLTINYYCHYCHYSYCRKCICHDHRNHRWNTIQHVNAEIAAELNPLLVRINEFLNHVKNAKKELYSIELQLTEYVTETMENIIKHFISLHNLLQNEEKRLSEEIMAFFHQTRYDLEQTYGELSDTDNLLNGMRCKLEMYQRQPPNNVLLKNIIDECRDDFNDLPNRLCINKLNKNPFEFEIRKDVLENLTQYYAIKFNNPNIHINAGDNGKRDIDLKPSSQERAIDRDNKILEDTMDISIGLNYTLNENEEESMKIDDVISSPPQLVHQEHQQSDQAEQKQQSVTTKTAINNGKSEADDRNASNNKVIQRTEIVITYIKSPSEFYINSVDLMENAKSFHERIQQIGNQKWKKSTDRVEGNHSKQWKLNDNCLIYKKLSFEGIFDKRSNDLRLSAYDKCSWYRGIIRGLNNTEPLNATYDVFLCDIGLTLPAVCRDQMYPIDEQIECISHNIERCHLALVAPRNDDDDVDGEWSQKAIDDFKDTIKQFESLSATMHCEPSLQMESTPIVLWGCTTSNEGPLSPCLTTYTIINRLLINAAIGKQPDAILALEGNAEEMFLRQYHENYNTNLAGIARKNTYLTLLKHPIAHSINEMKNNDLFFLSNSGPSNEKEYNIGDNDLKAINYQNSFELNDALSKEPTTGQTRPPSAWLTNRVIDKSVFYGYPIYIDHNCTIYIQKFEDYKIIDEMTNDLGKAYGSMAPPPSDYEYVVGQPCVASYKSVNLNRLYRCFIVSSTDKKNEWSLYYIDYGNIESVHCDFMRPYAPYPNCPAMVHKFRIAGIKPKNNSCKYSSEALLFIHRSIVGKAITVRILNGPYRTNEDIRLCSLYMQSTDIKQSAITLGYVDVDEGLAMQVDNNSQDCRPSTSNHNETMNPLTDNSTRLDLPNLIRQTSTNFENNAKMNGEVLNLPSNTDNRTHNGGGSTLTQSPPSKRRTWSTLDCSEFLNEIPLPCYEKYDSFTSNNDIPKNNHDSVGEKQDLTKDNWYDKPPYNNNSIKKPSRQRKRKSKRKKRLTASPNLTTGNADENGQKFEEECCENNTTKMHSQECKSPNAPIMDQESEFEEFHPIATSSTVTRVSGLDKFRPLHIPSDIKDFYCTVITVLTPTIVQIVPHIQTCRFSHYRLQHFIQQRVETLPSLQTIKPGQICLACYTKDNKWYRAVVCSYHNTTEMVQVIYVDYLNSETLPKYKLKMLPVDLIKWPLRVLRVRLHGIKSNNLINNHVVRWNMEKLLKYRSFYAVIKNDCITENNDQDFIDSYNDNNLMEIDLYDSKVNSLNNNLTYKCLVDIKLLLQV